MERLLEIIKNVNPILTETNKKIVSDGLMDSVDLVGFTFFIISSNLSIFVLLYYTSIVTFL